MTLPSVMKLGVISLALTTDSISPLVRPFGAMLGRILSNEKKAKVKMV